jgi:hypothetical protein
MLRGFNGGCKDQRARLLLEESITLRLWLDHLGLELLPASTLSDNLNAVSNQTPCSISLRKHHGARVKRFRHKG